MLASVKAVAKGDCSTLAIGISLMLTMVDRPQGVYLQSFHLDGETGF